MISVKLTSGVTIEHIGEDRVFVSHSSGLGGADIVGKSDAVSRAIVPLMEEVARLTRQRSRSGRFESFGALLSACRRDIDAQSKEIARLTKVKDQAIELCELRASTAWFAGLNELTDELKRMGRE